MARCGTTEVSDVGRGIYEGSPRTERVQLETRSSDPTNPSNGEAWLRTDLTGTDKVAEYRWYDGASVNAVDVVTPGTTSSPVEEVLRVQTPTGKGVIKTAPRSDATYPEQSLQHSGSPLGLGYSAIPDSEDLQAHWDVTQESLSDGDSITTLTDQSGNGNDLSAVGSPKANANGIGSNTTASLDGVDDGFEWPIPSSISQPYSIFFVAKQNATYSFQELWRTRATNNYFADTGGSWSVFAGNSTIDSGTTPDTTAHVFDTFAKSTDELYLDGTQEASGDAGGDALQDTFHLGYDPDNSRFMELEFGELLLYPQDKSGIRSDVEQYLADKWGITI